MLRTLILGIALCAGFAQAQQPRTHQHAFKDAERWAHVFDDPARDSWQKPHEVIQALDHQRDGGLERFADKKGFL